MDSIMGLVLFIIFAEFDPSVTKTVPLEEYWVEFTDNVYFKC